MKKIIFTLLIFIILISIILVSNIKPSESLKISVPQFQPVLYNAGNNFNTFNLNNQQIEVNNSWDFPYYIVYKFNNTYYKVEKTTKQTPLMDSSYNVTEAYQWFLGTKITNKNNQTIRNYNLIFPKAFTNQPTEFYNYDSVLVCSADTGIIYIINKDFLPTNSDINNEFIEKIPSNKIQKIACIANHEIYFPLHKLSEGLYTLFLEKQNHYSAINTAHIEVKEGLTNKIDSLPTNNFIQLNVYPNPAHSFINIDFNSNQTFVNFEIVNIDGTLVLQNSTPINNNKINISIQNLNSGIYYIKVYDNNKVGIAKFIKN